MSINQLVKPVKKEWLDGHIGGITVDGAFNYKNSQKAPGDVLVLDSNKIAVWQPETAEASANTATALVLATQLSSATSIFRISSDFSHPVSVYSFGSNFIKVKKSGSYLVIFNLEGENNTNAVAIEIAINGFGISETRLVDNPTTTITTPIYNNLFTFRCFTLDVDDEISVIGNSPGGGIFNSSGRGSRLTVVKLD